MGIGPQHLNTCLDIPGKFQDSHCLVAQGAFRGGGGGGGGSWQQVARRSERGRQVSEQVKSRTIGSTTERPDRQEAARQMS